MTLNEFGLKLRNAYPRLNEIPLDNEQLAQYILNRYPQYYDFISPTARKLKELAEAPITYHRKGFFESSAQDGLNYGQEIANRRARIDLLHHTDNVIRASSMGVPVEVLPKLAELEAEHHHKIAYETFVINNGLNGANRHSLKPLELLNLRRAELNRLIDERDNESHPDKREVLDILIEAAKEELRGRANQAVVQAGGGSGLRELNESSDTDSNSRKSDEGDVESVPSAKSRVGF